MICRMTKYQREALVELIQAFIAEKNSQDIEDSLRLLEAEEQFDKLFANQETIEDENPNA